MSGAAPKKKKLSLAEKLKKKRSKTTSFAGLDTLAATPDADKPASSKKASFAVMPAAPEGKTDSGIQIGNLRASSGASTTEDQRMEHEQTKRSLENARRLAAQAKEAEAAAPPPKQEGYLRKRYVPPSQAAAAAPAEIVSLAKLAGGEAAPKAAPARSGPIGVWGIGPSDTPVEAVAETPALGMAGPAIPTSSSLCSGPELSPEALEDAVRVIIGDLRADRSHEARAKEVCALRPADGAEARVLAARIALLDCPHWESHESARVGPFLVSLLEGMAFTAPALREELAKEVYPYLADAVCDAPLTWKVVAAALRPLVAARTLRSEPGSSDIAAMPSELRKEMKLGEFAESPEEDDEPEAEAAAPAQAPEPAPAPAEAPAPAPYVPASRGGAGMRSAAPAAAAPAPAPSAQAYVPRHLRADPTFGGLTRPAAAAAASMATSDSEAKALLDAAAGKKKTKKAKKPETAATAVAATDAEAAAALAAAGKKKKKKKAKKADA